jgi:hypothetical protein
MKKFLTVMTLLTVIATPAFAQSFNPKDGTGNVLPFAYAPHNADNGHAAFAQAPEASARAERNVSAQTPMDNHGNLGGSVVNGYVVDGY